MGYWDSQAEYQEEQHTPAPIIMEEGNELCGYCMTAADHIICMVHSDHLHHNDFKKLYGYLADDTVW